MEDICQCVCVAKVYQINYRNKFFAVQPVVESILGSVEEWHSVKLFQSVMDNIKKFFNSVLYPLTDAAVSLLDRPAGPRECTSCCHTFMLNEQQPF